MNRDFKGIWIPKEIWLHENLSLQAKCLWAEIWSLHDPEKGGCFASDEYLMNFLGLGLSRFKEVLKELRDIGLVKNVSFDGRVRTMKAMQPFLKEEKEDENQLAGKPATGQPENRLPHGRKTGYPTIIENKEEKKDKIIRPDCVLVLTDLFLKKLKERNPKLKDPSPSAYQKWLDEMDRLMRLDKATVEDITRAIDWIQTAKWYQSNILSVPNLRTHWNKIISNMEETSEQDLIRKNREYALKIKEQYPEKLKGLTFDANYAMNRATGKEVSFKMGHEAFKNAFVALFGGRRE